jgi:hypothetical protein
MMSQLPPGLAQAPTENKEAEVVVAVDDRLPAKKRELRAKKALNFVEAGKYISEAAAIEAKEEKKMIAGYSSGRKALQKQQQSKVTVPTHFSLHCFSHLYIT